VYLTAAGGLGDAAECGPQWSRVVANAYMPQAKTQDWATCGQHTGQPGKTDGMTPAYSRITPL